jgi:transcriptional regulator with XRE-family HTH domain
VSIWKRNRLRVLRAERRLTQNDVAGKLGISQASYWQIETGLREPDAKTQTRIAKALRVTVADLLPQEAKAS